MATLASFPGSPRTGSDGKLGGAWEWGYGNPIPRPRKMKNDRIRKWQQMFLKDENLQFTSLLPVPVEWFLLLKSWTFATEHYKITPRFFLFFLHSYVELTLRATFKFAKPTDTNCQCQSDRALTTTAKRCLSYLGWKTGKNEQVFGQTVKSHFAANHFMEPVYTWTGTEQDAF